MPLQPTAPISCGKTTTATQPSAIAIAAASHFGASTQANLSRIAASAPPQTTARIIVVQAPSSTSTAKGVYVPAINRKMPAWSTRRDQR